MYTNDMLISITPIIYNREIGSCFHAELSINKVNWNKMENIH